MLRGALSVPAKARGASVATHAREGQRPTRPPSCADSPASLGGLARKLCCAGCFPDLASPTYDRNRGAARVERPKRLLPSREGACVLRHRVERGDSGEGATMGNFKRQALAALSVSFLVLAGCGSSGGVAPSTKHASTTTLAHVTSTSTTTTTTLPPPPPPPPPPLPPTRQTTTRTTRPGATAICKDGTYSYSHHRSTTCSKHGGVQRFLF